MLNQYAYNAVFQQKLLALLVRQPEKVLDLIEPQYFSCSPIFVEIARIAGEAYRKHGIENFRLTRSTLAELVRSASGFSDDIWPEYKSEIKKLFKMEIPDESLLIEHATEFAKEQRYRDALILAEKHVTTHSYQRAFEVIEEAQTFVVHNHSNGVSTGDLTWDTLPRFDPRGIKHTKWLIENFIAQCTISLIYGPRGSFKSTFFLAAAGTVANGEEFLGMETRRRKVLYLDFENPQDVIKHRNEDLQLNLPKNKNLVIWDRFGEQPPPRPGDPRLERFVVHCVRKLRKKPWIIFDSWSSFLRPGEGGETTGQIAPIYAHLRRLCDLGATITILDHTRKYEQGIIYGGQDKEAKADTIHNFAVHENKVKPTNPILRVDSWLKRYAPNKVGSFAAEVRSHQDKHGTWHISRFREARDPVVAEKSRQKDILRDLIRQNPDKSQRELAKLAAASGIGRDKAEELLKAGVGKTWSASENAKGKITYKLLDENDE